MAKLVKTNGEVSEVQPANGTDFSLEELQGFVGGMIELVDLPEDMLMVVNEEGLLLGLELNPVVWIITGRTIAGDVLVCRSDEVK